MQETLLTLHHADTRRPEYALTLECPLSLPTPSVVAVYGPNASGKTLLADLLTAKHPLRGDGGLVYGPQLDEAARKGGAIAHVLFKDVYGGAEPAYYQQRWNHGDEQVFPTVAEQLAALNTSDSSDPMTLLRQFGVSALAHRAINTLSSGELRKVQLLRTLSTRPRLLIIDSPFIGLDVEARATLCAMLQQIGRELTLMVVVSRRADVPDFADYVLSVDHRHVSRLMPRAEWQAAAASSAEQENPSPKAPTAGQTSAEGEAVIDFRNITIAYGSRKVLNRLNWCVKKGERWALTGSNGSGKTTLLSLVCADNPIAYACDIRLFGCRRGRGESIWDIKRRIGYVSPEMFSAYRKDLDVMRIVASGLMDTIGLYCRHRPEDEAVCLEWLKAFGAEHLARRNYLTLSSGEQRLVLLVRAFVKSPELLILDEPFHGLDDAQTRRAMRVIDDYMTRPDKTLLMVTHYADELPDCITHTLRLPRHTAAEA